MQGYMDPRQRLLIEKVAAWCGPVFVLSFLVFFGYYGHNFPYPQALPSYSIPEIAEYYRQNMSDVRFAFTVFVVLSPLYFCFAVSMAMRSWRIEGRYPVWAWVDICGGAFTAVSMSVASMAWVAITYQTIRMDPVHIQMLNDFAWFNLILQWVCTSSQMVATALIGWIDKRPNEKKWIPRWLSVFSIICAIAFIPCTGAAFTYSGPFSWGGIFAFHIPFSLWMLWIVVVSIMLIKSINKDTDNPERQFEIVTS